jgi:hypothetical protein
MTQLLRNRHNEPLDSSDLSLCQSIFETVCREHEIPAPSEESTRLAAIIIELFQQGVRERAQLATLAAAARGLQNPENKS